jgi:predicted short-subunit dehydrogenase-like oxidoreductase (DUF2520 family)
MQKVSFIGSGKVAWHLAKALHQKGFQIGEIYSRSTQNAQLLAQEVAAKVNTNLDFTSQSPDLLLVAVSDNALAEVVGNLKIGKQTIVAHTSGSIGLEVFRKANYPYAVFYPLQTFSKNRNLDFSKIPICLEANNEEIYIFLEKIAHKLSANVSRISSAQRKVLHIAAVFACNFVNHLLAISKNILDKEQLSFDLLKPLIQETITKALEAKHPKEVQTGPAVRGDNLVLQKHIAYLAENLQMQKLYKLLSESIQHFDEEK